MTHTKQPDIVSTEAYRQTKRALTRLLERGERSEKLDLVSEALSACSADQVDDTLYQRLKYGVFAVTEREQRDAALVHAAFRLVQSLREEDSQQHKAELLGDAIYFVGRSAAAETLAQKAVVNRFFADLERDSEEPTEANLHAWLWFTCPATLRSDVEPAIRADSRWPHNA